MARVQRMLRVGCSFVIGFALVVPAAAAATVTPIRENDVISTVAGDGTFGFFGEFGDGGLALHAQLGETSAIARDAFGNLYIADNFNNVVRKVSPSGIITTVAGTGAQPPYQGPSAPVGDGGPGTSAPLAFPSGLATDAAGSLYIADDENGEVRKLSPEGTITAVAGHWSSVRAVGHCDGIQPSFRWHYAVGAAGGDWSAPSDPTYTTCPGNVYGPADVPGLGPETIDGVVKAWPGETLSAGYDFRFASATLVGVKVELAQVAFNVSCVSRATPSQSTLAVTMPDANLTLNSPSLWYPSAAPNSPATYEGSIVVPDLCDGGPVSLAQGGTFTASLSDASGYSGDGRPATAADLSPSSVAVDAVGDLFIADGSNNVVRMVPARTGVYYGQFMWAGDIYTIAGDGTLGVSDRSGPALQQELALGNGQIAVDDSGDLFIVEGGGVTVVEEYPSGYMRTFAGDLNLQSFAPSGDGGPATQAQLACPEGIAINALGDVLISDECFGDVREVAPDGIISPVVNGNLSFGYSGDGGPAIDAETVAPGSLAFDDAGNLFLADTGNYVVREVADSSWPWAPLRRSERGSSSAHTQHAVSAATRTVKRRLLAARRRSTRRLLARAAARKRQADSRGR